MSELAVRENLVIRMRGELQKSLESLRSRRDVGVESELIDEVHRVEHRRVSPTRTTGDWHSSVLGRAHGR
ncbi:MAG: hypothetical protein U5K30_11495 [Acidimicrobiales bacterium]|nr:hypothetical protein [Acidimicrobiales bacterium]